MMVDSWSRELVKQNKPFALSVSNRSGIDFVGIGDAVTCETIVSTPAYRVATLTAPKMKHAAVKETVANFSKTGVTTAIFMMPHPWDLYALKEFRRSGIATASVVHDHEPHDGDRWPSRHFIRKRNELSDSLIFFSDFVQSRTAHRKAQLRILIPHTLIPNVSAVAGAPDSAICFGRMLGYKSLELLFDAWELAHTNDRQLLVAGEGIRNNGDLPIGVTVKSGWIEEDELIQMVNRCSVSILPYRNATQSGVTALSLALGNSVAVTPVGGLPEQLSHPDDGAVSIAVTPDSFASAINRAFAISEMGVEQRRERQVSRNSEAIRQLVKLDSYLTAKRRD